MGDIGIDKWVWKMNEHIRRGHHIVKYNETDDKIADENEQQRLLSKRVNDGKQEAET